MGISIPTVSNASAQSGGNDVSRNAILSFLVNEKPRLFSSFLVISQSQAGAGVFKVDLLTQYGTYFARVVNNGLLYLSSVSMTSSDLCSDLSASEHTANSAVSALNAFLRANYSYLNSFTLGLVQGFMKGPNINYRFLYAQGSTRYEFLLAYSSAINKYLTTKATRLNGGACDSSSVLAGGQCVRNCTAFAF
jgi:hypothetical protein